MIQGQVLWAWLLPGLEDIQEVQDEVGDRVWVMLQEHQQDPFCLGILLVVE